MATRPAAVELSRLEEFELAIEKLVAGGEGLGRYKGTPIFVPRSAPGDRLLVRLVERHSQYGRAVILRVLEPGAGRREPPCPHFNDCGGCDLQHLEDGLQTKLKVTALRETLERLGRVPWPERVEVVTGGSWAYRLRAQWQVEQGEAGVKVGYFAPRSHRLVPVRNCPILRPELDTLLAGLAERLSATAPSRLDVATDTGGAVTVSPPQDGLPRGEIRIGVGEHRYTFDARCFFQSHAGLLGSLVQAVVGDERGGAAYDLYAGVGLFSLPLAARYERVTAVEGDRVAARYARRNARDGGAKNVEVVAQAVETWIEALPSDVDRVVVDPPRSGMAPPVRRALLSCAPRRVTYVSCHPAALARDLLELTPTYEIDRLVVLEQFPQTGHLEAVVQLRRRRVGSAQAL